MKKIIDSLMEHREWLKIVFLAFCIAIFLMIFQFMFVKQEGRYKPLYRGGYHNLYIDTATGAVYDISGKLISRPGQKY